MGDRVAVMSEGYLMQVDSPLRLYDKPQNLFVAGFIGSPAMNLLKGTRNADGVNVGGYTIPVPRDVLAKTADTEITVGVRPESLKIADSGIPVEISVVEDLGADAYLYGIPAGLPDDQKLIAAQIVARVASHQVPGKGKTIKVVPDPEKLHVFSTSNGDRLN